MIFCGIDGGQTSTKCVLGTENGELIGTGLGGPLIHLSAQGGEEQFVSSISQAIESAWSQASSTPQEITAVVVGATGIFEDTIESATAIRLLAPVLNTPKLDVCSDALIALMGAHAGDPGIMVIAGTGTIAYGLNRAGTVARAGGWGWPMGDHGSAFAIGRAGLRAALHAHDKMAPETALTELILEHFQVGSIHDTKRIYFSPDFGADSFGALAPLVSQAANRGDSVAQAIIRTSGQDLAIQAIAVAEQLNLTGSQPIPVAPVGGAFQHISGLSEAFSSALALNENQNREPNGERVAFEVRAPQLSPRCGAFVMALKQSGIPIDSKLVSTIQAWD